MMGITAEEITLKRLALAKLLYQQAAVQVASTHSAVSNILAVVIFDLAAETALKAVVSALEPSKPPSRDFQGVIQQADDLLAKHGLGPVPDKTNLQHIHDLRNDAQHKAKYPGNTQVQDCRTYIRDFLNKLFMHVWGLSLEALSLTEIIKNQEVKADLIAAESALNAGEYDDALISAEKGFASALSRVKSVIVGRMDSGANPNLDYVAWDRSHPSTFQVLDNIRDHIVRSTLGLSFSDYMRYSGIVKSVIHSMAFFGGGKTAVAKTGRKTTATDAEFVVTYAINAVIQMEGVVGSLDAPFECGENHELGRRLRFT